MRLLDAARDVRTIKQLLTEAEAEARRGGTDTPGPEHLLLAATTLPDGSAAAALAHVAVSAETLREAVDRVHAEALAPLGLDEAATAPPVELQAAATGPFRSSPQAQQVFAQAVALSKARTPSRLRGADVVAAACDLDRGTVPRALAALGVAPDVLRDAAVSEAARA